MGIGEMEFERRFASELADLRDSQRVAGVIGGRYVHDPLGIAFDLPHGWRLRDLQEISDANEGLLLSSHNDELNDAHRSGRDLYLPLVAISAPTWDDPVARIGGHELSPLVALQFEHAIPDDETSTFDLQDHVATDLSYIHAYVEDFRLLGPPAPVQLSGCAAITYTAAYTALHADDAEGCHVCEQTYYVLHESAVYALRLLAYPDRHERLAFDFAPFVRTVCFR